MSGTSQARSLLWQVLAPVVRWPLHSPRRLMMVIAAALVVMWGVIQLQGDDPAPPAATPSATATTAPTTAAPTVDDEWSDPPAAETAPVTGDPVAVALDFARNWARPNRSQARWLAGVRPYTTAAYQQRLSSIVPSNIPATRIGLAEITGQSETSRIIRIQAMPRPAAGVVVTLIPEGGAWRVSSILPAQQ